MVKRLGTVLLALVAVLFTLGSLWFANRAVGPKETTMAQVEAEAQRGENPMHQRLLQQYRVKGVPTVVFLDAQGKERSELRLVDFLPPNQFLSRMAEIKGANSQKERSLTCSKSDSS